MNAFKHGLDAESMILPGENAVDYESLVDEYYAQFDPRSPLEEQHVATLIHCDWMRRRLRRTQGNIYRALLTEGPKPTELDVTVLRDSATAKLLRRVTSELAALDRSYLRALNDLRLLDNARQELRFARLQAEIQPPIDDDDLDNLASFPEPPESLLSHPQAIQYAPETNPALRL